MNIAIAVTGASGSIYAKLLVEKLLLIKSQWKQLSVVMTENAKLVWQTELGNESYKEWPVSFYSKNDFTAPFASGSGKYNTMIIVPCSMGTLGRIASGISNDLICVLRETPYNLIHIKNMETITLAGGIICPATPSFYSKPSTIDEVASTVVDRVLDLAGLDITTFRWGK